MLLKLLRQGDGVKVVETIDGFSQAFVVLLFDEHLVERFVDGLVVVLLHIAKVGLDEAEVIDAGEEADRASVVQARREHQQEVVDQEGLVVQVELQRAVVELNVGHLCDDLFEEALPPGLGGVGDHGQDGVVVLLVLVIEEDQLGPQVCLLCCTQDLGGGGRREEAGGGMDGQAISRYIYNTST